jgi:TPP-dependent pyruvate/acetoin dehydrogenase alpha subunit
VKLYRDRCRERAVVGETEVAAMVTAITTEIDEAVAFAKVSPFPTRDQLTAHLYAP